MREYKQSGLRTVMIEITHRCNQNCLHCYLGSKKEVDLSVDTIYKILDESRILGVEEIVFTGGEPSLHKDWRDILNYALSNGFRIQLETTNTGLSDEDIDLLKKIHEIHLSIDAPPGRKSVMRTQKYNHEIVEFAKRLKSRECNPFFFSTLHKENLCYLEEMIELASELKIPIRLNFLLREGKATTVDKRLFLTNLEIKDLFFKLHDEYQKGRIPRTKIIYECLIDPDCLDAIRKTRNPIIGGCIAGIATCVITPYGDVIPCPHLRISLGNIREKRLEEIWFDSTLLNRLRNRENYKTPCGGCEYRPICGGCRAAAFHTTGDVCGADPYCFKTLI